MIDAADALKFLYKVFRSKKVTSARLSRVLIYFLDNEQPHVISTQSSV